MSEKHMQSPSKEDEFWKEVHFTHLGNFPRAGSDETLTLTNVSTSTSPPAKSSTSPSPPPVSRRPTATRRG